MLCLFTFSNSDENQENECMKVIVSSSDSEDGVVNRNHLEPDTGELFLTFIYYIFKMIK